MEVDYGMGLSSLSKQREAADTLQTSVLGTSDHLTRCNPRPVPCFQRNALLIDSSVLVMVVAVQPSEKESTGRDCRTESSSISNTSHSERVPSFAS